MSFLSCVYIFETAKAYAIHSSSASPGRYPCRPTPVVLPAGRDGLGEQEEEGVWLGFLSFSGLTTLLASHSCIVMMGSLVVQAACVYHVATTVVFFSLLPFFFRGGGHVHYGGCWVSAQGTVGGWDRPGPRG
jgi:hypothetical protein